MINSYWIRFRRVNQKFSYWPDQQVDIYCKTIHVSVAIRTFQNTDKIFTANTFRNLKPQQVSVLTQPFDKTFNKYNIPSNMLICIFLHWCLCSFIINIFHEDYYGSFLLLSIFCLPYQQALFLMLLVRKERQVVNFIYSECNGDF